MIRIENTDNLTGVSISGDWDDLDKLVDAFYEITISEDSQKHKEYINLSIRVLGLCYDIRHAKKGDREIELVDNNMDDETMKWHSMITPKKNVYYKCNYLYPEMFFAILVLNDLIKLRMKDLSKVKTAKFGALSKKVVWDETISTIRSFQAEFAKCVKETLSEATYARWLNVMNSDYNHIKNISGQYVDLLNVRYINMSKEKRLKSLSSIAKKIADHIANDEHADIKESVREAAIEYKCSEADIKIKGVEYPEDIEW